LLDLLIERAQGVRLLVIITFRPEFSPPWVGRPQVTLLTLNRLPPRQGIEMIANVTSGKSLPKDVAEQIINRTDGVPLFIEELTKAVLESGIVIEAGDHYSVAVPMAHLAIPSSLHASLLARLDRLAPTREVAQIGAALGRAFSYQLISAVAGMPQRKIDEALDQLASAELIFRRGVPPDAEYTFKHALVQDAAYSTLLRSRRQQLHARIATTLERSFPEIVAAEPAILAHHCAEAGLGQKAVTYRLKAGQQAVARSAMAEAVAQLENGLRLLTTMPLNPERQLQELDLRIALGPALIATTGYSSPKVGEVFAQATVLAEEIDRPEYLVPLLYGQWAYHLVRAEHRLALPFAERMEQIGDARNNAAELLQGRFYHGIVRFFLGELSAARALFERCDGLREPAVRQALSELTAEDGYSVMLGYLGITLAHLGYFDQARLRASEGLLEARRLQHAYTLAFCLVFKCWVASVANLPDEVRQHSEEMFDLANEHGFPVFLAHATSWRGWWSAAVGQASDGVSLIAKAMQLLRATGSAINIPNYLASQAEANGKLGQSAEGLSRLGEALQFIEATDERPFEAEVYRLRGDLLTTTGAEEMAEQDYRRALAVAGRQGARTLELRAAISLARLWRDQGKQAEARDLLAPIYGWFTEGFDTPVLQAAKNLLDELRR
jgi:tetratricopeptide (TPR) repeat protein